MFKAIVALVLVALLLVPPSVRADSPDYAVPGRFVLPWRYGDGYRITWDMEGHWAYGTSVGVAFDVSMVEGTPVLAPADGLATFVGDDRPYVASYGNYVDLLVGDDWLVRLAHLHDYQEGTRVVQAGELLGYSGCSGTEQPHLHVEVRVRQGDTWGRPDVARLTQFFGLPLEEFAIGVIITNSTPYSRLLLDGPIELQAAAPLGEPVDLVVPLANVGGDSAHLTVVQLAFRDPLGMLRVAETSGDWVVQGQGVLAVPVRLMADRPGLWSLLGLTCVVDDEARRQPVTGEFTVAGSTLRLVGVSARPLVAVGERIELEAWFENPTDETISFTELVVGGVQPNGAEWLASTEKPVSVSGGATSKLKLRSTVVPQHVGAWSIRFVGYRDGDQLVWLAPMEQAFEVQGPELVVSQLSVYQNLDGFVVLARIRNVGTSVALPSAIEVWGWKDDGQESFSSVYTRFAPLEPGRTTLVQLCVAIDDREGTQKIAGIGYWMDGNYYGMPLSEHPVLSAKGMAGAGL